ncbi:uncharacterized protein A1O5_06647 [Cladophialophora psammophila CBS 110553]|uniref:GST N-terminal domain-containing protein n=1 Tax=Cladophialophora psammophila CBS 110553 TaxID=1182543 RepID=W9WQU5_9EURO|nr:uncharacterized protein A1O5_06647 [Cladophialophora psammophila CBS 110553]EXJ70577.1 hypothetical protein A1O5_06647 [Cladophialophora psammophila CBS 110553]
MVRLTYALRGPPSRESNDMKIEFRTVDIAIKLEQFTEDFLCNVNPKGKVPVLYHPTLLSHPMSESIAISDFICDRYPTLRPPEHAGTIDELIKQLHDISFYSLTYQTRPEHPEAMRLKLQELMNQPDVSPRYKDALQNKIKLNDEEKVIGLQAPSVAENIEKAKAFCEKMECLLANRPGSESMYLFGDNPTVLDAHTLPFLIRMQDVGKEFIIPDGLAKYMGTLKRQKEWEEISPNGKTIPDMSLAGLKDASLIKASVEASKTRTR